MAHFGSILTRAAHTVETPEKLVQFSRIAMKNLDMLLTEQEGNGIFFVSVERLGHRAERRLDQLRKVNALGWDNLSQFMTQTK